MTARPGAAPTAVFFDFAGTLFDDRALREVHLQQLRHLGELCDIQAGDAQLRAAYRRGVACAYGEIAATRYYSHRALFAAAFSATARALGASITPAQADGLVDRQYAATVAHTELRCDTMATLAALHDRGLHVQIVSNIDTEQIDSLVDKLALQPVIDAWTSSEEARSCKPDDGIFRAALGKAECDPRSVVFVGDTPAHDIVPPARLGMRTVLLARAPAGASLDDGGADHVIHALSGVTDLIESLAGVRL